MLPRFLFKSGQKVSSIPRSARRRRLETAVEALETRQFLSAFTFAAPKQFTLPYGAQSIAAADFNGDGHTDLVVANTGKASVTVLLGNGDGTFQIPSSPGVDIVPTNAGKPYLVATADLRGDGKMDIITACLDSNHDGVISVMLGNGDGTFKAPEIYTGVSASPSSMVIANLNGHEDVAETDLLNGGVTILLGNGDGTFNPTPLDVSSAVAGASTYSMAAGTFKGKTGLVVTALGQDQAARILFFNSDGSFNKSRSVPIGGTGTLSAAVTDIDGDGVFDDVVAVGSNANSISATLANADGSFRSPIITNAIGIAQVTTAVADFSGDNKPDIVGLTSGTNIDVLPGLGNGSFGLPQSVPLAFTPSNRDVIAADVTGDGRPDLIVADTQDDLAVIVNKNLAAANKFISADQATFTAGSQGFFAVTTGNLNVTPTLSETGTLPVGLSFVDNQNGTASLSGTPDAAAGGLYTITLTAKNGAAVLATQTLTIDVLGSTGFTSANQATFQTGVSGTFAIATTGFRVAQLTMTPAGLPLGLIFHDNGNGTATISGKPAAGTGNSYAFTLSAANSTGAAATQTFTLTVDQPVLFTSLNHATFTAGIANTFTVKTTGFPAVTSIGSSGSFGSGVTYTDNGNGTATIAGTPNPGSGGTYGVMLTANPGGVTQAFTLTINEAPAITSSASAQFTAGMSGSVNISTHGFPDARIFESGLLPVGLKFVDNHNDTATLSGTPAKGTGRTYSFVVIAVNGIGRTATQTFTLTVNEAPAFAPVTSATFHTGVPATFTIKTSGFSAAAITESGTLPTGITFHDNGNGTATLKGTPAADAGGIYNLSLNASNSTGDAPQQNFTLTVDQPLQFTSSKSASFTVNQAGTFTVTTTGFPAASIAKIGLLPNGLTFTSNGDGTATIAGTPAAGTDKAYVLVLVASNHVPAIATQVLTLSVDRSPAITSVNNVTFRTGVAANFTVTTTGFPAAALSEMGDDLPKGIAFHDNGNGTARLFGVPALGSGGTYAITLTAHGAGTDATQDFMITVNEPARITSPGPAIFFAGNQGSFTITTAGYPAVTLTRTGPPLPSGLSLQLPGSTTISGTPSSTGNTARTYVLTLTADNGIGLDIPQRFLLVVEPTP